MMRATPRSRSSPSISTSDAAMITSTPACRTSSMFLYDVVAAPDGFRPAKLAIASSTRW